MIELYDVTKVYQMGSQQVAALNGIDLSIGQGEMTAIMGPSGSGKSTVMNIIGCLDVPSSGRYLLEGQEVGSLSDDSLAGIRNEKIGFVFQTYNLLPRLTAQANVELPLLYGNGHDARRRSLEALDKVGLKDRAQHRPTELSGGEQQRVGIARALVKAPSILLTDEPTGNLDSGSSMEIIAILQQLNRDDGITVIVVTHEPEIAAYTRRIISVRDGKVVNDEPVSKPQIVLAPTNKEEKSGA
ncbi:MAG: putative ABC transport system ATP-binding protein [Chloroflexi bacterium]|nr:MAG: putative ABC transport system ATP-binding protein [Chloroflexota bacterium]